MQKSVFKIGTITAIMLLVTTVNADAHVVVRPAETNIGAFQTFTIGVPVEKDLATTEIRLVIPEGLDYVTPNVKPGWKVDIKKDGKDQDAKVTEIIWSGGTIPPGQRDDFLFSAKVPSTPTTVQWKAYQTYADKSVVAWDQPPADNHGQSDFSENGPYSQTKVIDDIKSSPTTVAAINTKNSSSTQSMLTYLALAVSILALGVSVLKRK